MLTMNGLINRLLGLLEMPFSERHIIITLVLQGEKTYVRVDLEENVKATSILCLLGFGIGFGSVLLYKIYARFVSRYPQLTQTASSQTTSHPRKRQHSTSNARKVTCNPSSDSDEEDSDDDNGNKRTSCLIDNKTMGNTGSVTGDDATVYYSACRNGVSFANYPGNNDWASGASNIHPQVAPVDIPASPMQRHLHQRKLSRGQKTTATNDSKSVLPTTGDSLVNNIYANIEASKRDRSISDVQDRLQAEQEQLTDRSPKEGSPGACSNDSVKITNFDEVSLLERTTAVSRRRRSSPADRSSRSQRNSVEFESLCQKRDNPPAHCVSDGDLLPDAHGNLKDPADHAPPWLGGGAANVDISEVSSPDYDPPGGGSARPRLPSGNASDIGDIFNASFRRLNFRREAHSVDAGLYASTSPEKDAIFESATATETSTIRTVLQFDKLEGDIDNLKADMNVIFARIHQLSKGSEPSDTDSSDFDLEAYRNREVSRAMNVLLKYRRSSVDATSLKSSESDSETNSRVGSPAEKRRASSPWLSPVETRRCYYRSSPPPARASVTPERGVREEDDSARRSSDSSDKSELSLPISKPLTLDDTMFIHGARCIPRTELLVVDDDEDDSVTATDDLTNLSGVHDVSSQASSSTSTPDSDMSSLYSPVGTLAYLPSVPEHTVIMNCDDNGNSGGNSSSSSSSGIDNFCAADNVGTTRDVYSYAEALPTTTVASSRTSTADVDTIRQGFHAILEHSNCRSIRHINKDNYCAIRAALFQVLRNKFPIAGNLGPIDGVIQKLRTNINSNHAYLKRWNFGRIFTNDDDVVTTDVETIDLMTQCLHGLYNQLNSLSPMTAAVDRESSVVSLMNSSRQTDRMLMEAVKLLMMATVIRLYDDMKSDKEVPVFAWLMFARETSQNPRMFFARHLDKIGHTSGLEQVEMFLLAYTLGVSIEVIRPHEFGRQDYVTFYQSGFSAAAPPVITLVTEDDIHYDVVLP
ncbi:uncharacterized protein LOC141913318 isoform X2 [Tubulanus polymorphus]|uniref:uncharacterized protein LOC141913318 isoform X2 n=1 Tax=Tubulanus polymorphus TaxID=672921 RepID=UPI003DA2A31F